MRLQQASQRNSHHFIGRWAPKTTKLIVHLSSFVECFYCLELNIYTSSNFSFLLQIKMFEMSLLVGLFNYNVFFIWHDF